jgi:predicted nucleic acid-binding protein
VEPRGTVRLLAAFDTDLLAYAEGVNDPDRQAAAQRVIDAIPAGSVFLPVQVLGELFQVLVRKGKRTPRQARDAVASWQAGYRTVPTTDAILVAAIGLAADHQVFIWNAVVIAAAAAAGCHLLLSEDMHEGFTWGGVTIVNPFAATPHPLLADLTRA